jgi:hypothetical protein
MEGSALSFLNAEWKVSDTDKVNWQQTTDDGRQVMAKAHIAFGKVN